MKIINNLLILLLACAVFVAACQKEGPAGPKGDTGPQGPKGDSGAIGPQGNANVVADTFMLTNTDYKSSYWSLTSSNISAFGIAAKIAEVNVPAITGDIMQNGVVFVYLKVPNGLTTVVSQWAPLPFTLRAVSVGYSVSIQYAFDTSKLRIAYLFEQTDAAATNVPNIFTATVPDYHLKYVVIAGQAVARMRNDGIDFHNYDAVMAYLKRK